jgi:hypothetical protein
MSVETLTTLAGWSLMTSMAVNVGCAIGFFRNKLWLYAMVCMLAPVGFLGWLVYLILNEFISIASWKA